MTAAAKKQPPVVRGPQTTLLTDKCPKCGREMGEHNGTKCPPMTAAQRKQRQREREREEKQRLEVRAGFAQLQGGAGALPVHQTVKDTDTGGDPMRWSAVPAVELPAELATSAPADPAAAGQPPRPGQPEAVTAALPPQPPTPDQIAGAKRLAGYLAMFWSFGGVAAAKLVADLEANPPQKQKALVALLVSSGKQALEHWNDKIVIDTILVAGEAVALKYKLTAATDAIAPPPEAIVAGAILVPALAIGANLVRAKKQKHAPPPTGAPRVVADDDEEEHTPRPDSGAPPINPDAWAAFGDIPGGRA